jgi:predicted RNA binding protein YcfA (HicA-like mRNA interferase family)
VKVREVMRVLRREGWQEVYRRGSHRQLRHPERPGKVTGAGNDNDELAAGTLASIARQAGIERWK